VVSLCHEKGFYIGNVDLTLIAQRPKLAPHLAEMRKNLSRLLQIQEDCIGIKATTHEGIGSLGREEGIAAHAVCLLFKT
jgi:2-C-methyl-D-erythritol 2,4-cyclodiphosphate synthase